MTIVSILCVLLLIVCALSRVRLCDPLDCGLPGSSVHGISQARILEWVATSTPGIFLTQGSNRCLLCLLCWQADSLPLHHLGILGILATVIMGLQKN